MLAAAVRVCEWSLEVIGERSRNRPHDCMLMGYAWTAHLLIRPKQHDSLIEQNRTHVLDQAGNTQPDCVRSTQTRLTSGLRIPGYVNM